jgi:hypothetical protein
MNPEEFATKKYPLRSSKLPALAACTLHTVTSMLSDDESVGTPADTGSALHRAIEEWHKNGHDETKALTAMRKDLSKYPSADLPDSADMFRAYILDPRNVKAEIVEAETEIEINLNPATFDPTKKEIVILGKLDQIRLVAGTYELWDVKSGNRQPDHMLRTYALQIAAYCFGATTLLGKQVNPGGIIRTRTYQRKRPQCNPLTEPDGVFIPCPFTYDDIDCMFDIIRQKVALVRMGIYSTSPHADYCGYCKIGLNNCNSLLKAMKEAKPNHGKEDSSTRTDKRKSSNYFGSKRIELPAFGT